MKQLYFIIDFDSTLVRLEGLDELASISLKTNPNKEKILSAIKSITEQGMAGTISFGQSLTSRLKLFRTTRSDIDALVRKLKKNITPSILRNKEFFTLYHDRIYIISGGFKDYIVPLFAEYHIDPSHVLANEFRYNPKGNVIGINESSYLAQDNGKVKQMKALNLQGTVYVLGDGYTDFQIKEAGLANKFFVFCENIQREPVMKKADYILPNFDEFLYINKLPRAYSYPKNRIKVLLLENISGTAVERLREEGYDVTSIAHALSEQELIERIDDIHILGIRSKTTVSTKVIEASSKLLAIGAFCIGTNQIDLPAAAKAGVPVFNAPFSNTRSVVELAIGEIISLMRDVPDKCAQLHKGIWDKSASGAHELRGKKLGIVGYGNIGSQLSVLMEGLGMSVYFYDIADKLALGNSTRCESLSQLLKLSDIVTVHVDGRPENRNLIGSKELSQMKEGVFFLNLSRGFVVDLDALAQALRTGHVAGAAVDVFPHEPKSNSELLSTPLQDIPHVILTPHIAGSTVEAQEDIGRFVSEKLIVYVNTGSTTLSVNMPNLQLPLLRKAHRLIHIHLNKPGVLASINKILYDHKVNIEGQYLKTENDIGYVITDVNKSYNSTIVRLLRAMPETIKLRILY